MNVFYIIADSISPQTKALVANITTGSFGLSTILEMMPTVIGTIGTIVGVAFSLVLTKNAIYKSRRDEKKDERACEIHELQKLIMQKKLDEEKD